MMNDGNVEASRMIKRVRYLPRPNEGDFRIF